MRGHWARFLFCLLLFFLPLLIGAAPLNEKEIPVYPGAVRDPVAEEEIRRDYEEYRFDYWEMETIRVYTVKALIDDVCRYYIDQLKPEPGWAQKDPYALAPGEVDGPWYEVGFWHETIFTTQYEYDTLLNDGEWVKDAFAKRPQWEKGSWLNSARFEWNAALPNGDPARYAVILDDVGFDSRERVDYRSTRIRIEVLVSPSLEAIEEEEDWAMDQAVVAKTEEFRKNPPTEELLGITLYPGAVFSPELTAGMSLNDDFHIYVYFSNDPPDKIADFYRKQLGKEPLSSGDLGYMFALKGSLPIPEEGLAIQANMIFDVPFQSMISIQKQMGN
ncbi:MAG TPA: hypothetical protein GXZ98_02175 [Firmicutes bacterium]|jgi:hypothetical protein|nr:hypothetical protein [Bacillota bacterium]